MWYLVSRMVFPTAVTALSCSTAIAPKAAAAEPEHPDIKNRKPAVETEVLFSFAHSPLMAYAGTDAAVVFARLYTNTRNCTYFEYSTTHMY